MYERDGTAGYGHYTVHDSSMTNWFEAPDGLLIVTRRWS
jgi:hypothetical protein